MGLKERRCCICGNDLNKINVWEEYTLTKHDFITGANDVCYICPRCFKKRIERYLKEDKDS